MSVFNKIFRRNTKQRCKCDSDIVYHAVLRILYDYDIYFVGGDTIENILRRNDKIKKIKEWANTLEDKLVKAKYLHWLNYFEKQNNEAIKRVLERRPSSIQSEYDKMTLKISECEKENPIPRYDESKNT